VGRADLREVICRSSHSGRRIGRTDLVFEYMFEYYDRMKDRMPEGPGKTKGPDWPLKAEPAVGTGPAMKTESAMKAGGPMKAMSPGVVDFLFRQLVAGEPPEDVQWRREGTLLADQAPGAELARRLSETDLEALTPAELFDYVRAAQRLAGWAGKLREAAVERYCSAGSPDGAGSLAERGAGAEPA
jgi:hypothetical protein